ncbi:hypothetical protein WG219_11380 [Ectopseudomonas mendocina]|uniref:Uncharacterized protein n=1 Tax=Ectopseudomonas mendocina TaxID=300 RepID=A0ABZ2RAL3_ECTME
MSEIEKVEVVAWSVMERPDEFNGFECRQRVTTIKPSRAAKSFELMTVAQHERIVEQYKKGSKELCEALRALLDDTQHAGHDCEDIRCPVAKAVAVLWIAEGDQP